MGERLGRPSLEYQHAFDLCASEIQRRGGPCVLRSSSPFYARELLKRIDALRPAQVAVEGSGEELQNILRRLGPEVDVAQAWSVAVPRPGPGANLWAETNNSGAPNMNQPGNGGAGTVLPGALEMSNVDLALEFTNMIIAQRGFQANSRAITTSDEMLGELVNLKR